MPCFTPLHAKKINVVDRSTGELKTRMLFPDAWKSFCTTSLAEKQADPDYVPLPCGQCIGCRVARSRDWALRCMHELKSHSEACFITLTYNEEHLPYRGTLVKKHFQDFMKRLRHSLGGKKIKYYMCGEYGEKRRRPHFHAIIFGHDFCDKVLDRRERGHDYFLSESLAKLWTAGFHVIGAVDFESCAYVARYVLKKAIGKDKHLAYLRKAADGSTYSVEPEYTCMSQGIGSTWACEYVNDCLPSGYIVYNGMKARLPKFYLKRFEIIVPERYKQFKAAQAERMSVLSRTASYRANHESLRLEFRQRHFEYKVKKLKRNYEADFV